MGKALVFADNRQRKVGDLIVTNNKRTKLSGDSIDDIG